jgi:hypothetical protein
MVWRVGWNEREMRRVAVSAQSAEAGSFSERQAVGRTVNAELFRDRCKKHVERNVRNRSSVHLASTFTGHSADEGACADPASHAYAAQGRARARGRASDAGRAAPHVRKRAVREE